MADAAFIVDYLRAAVGGCSHRQVFQVLVHTVLQQSHGFESARPEIQKLLYVYDVHNTHVDGMIFKIKAGSYVPYCT